MPRSAKPKHPLGSVCKPCWELMYCPYGPLVETFPLPDPDVDLHEIRTRHEALVDDFVSGRISRESLLPEIDRLLYLDPDNWEAIVQYDPEEIRCREWGHACPVFFTQSGATETKEFRREGRHIPRTIMFEVVRRDQYRCRRCAQNLTDPELRFDHVIPHSRGGPTSSANLQLLCPECNQTKSDKVDWMLKD